MSCCCTNTYKFCQPVDSCTGNGFTDMFKALADGVYTVQLDFLDSVIEYTINVASNVVTLNEGVTIILNERFTYTGKVINASGAVVSLIFGGTSYDCFQFDTKYFLNN